MGKKNGVGSMQSCWVRRIGVAAAFACGLTATQPALADTCATKVQYVDSTTELENFVQSNLCQTAGQLLSTVGKSALNSAIGAALAAYGLPGFTNKDPFAAHAAAIIKEIKQSRMRIVGEIDGLWLSLINDQKLIQSSSYTALLTMFGETWSGKSITAKIADLAELDVVINDLQALHDRLRALVLDAGDPSKENPTQITHFRYHDLLHIYLVTVDLLASARAENVYIDELAGRIQTCASDPNMDAATAQAQVNLCLSRLSATAREELERKIATETSKQVASVLNGAISFATTYSNQKRVLQTVFAERFGSAAGGSSGTTAGNFFTKLPSGTVDRTWRYMYNGKEHSIKAGAVATSSDGTVHGYRGSFDNSTGDYGSPEEVAETHRRKVYFEMLMVEYVPMRRLLDHWWEQLRLVKQVKGERPYLELDADIDALVLAENAPNYKPVFTNKYFTSKLAGIWRPTADQDMGGSGVRAIIGVSDLAVSTAQRALLIGGALTYGNWYTTTLFYAASVDRLVAKGKESWSSHLSLLRAHNRDGRMLTTAADTPGILSFYRGTYALKFIDVVM